MALNATIALEAVRELSTRARGSTPSDYLLFTTGRCGADAWYSWHKPRNRRIAHIVTARIVTARILPHWFTFVAALDRLALPVR
ncbi:MAG: hypothetical protein WA624_17100 [Methylocella sp.]